MKQFIESTTSINPEAKNKNANDLFFKNPETLISICISSECPGKRLGKFSVIDIHSLDHRITGIHQIHRSDIILRIPTSSATDILEKLKSHPHVLSVEGQLTEAGRKKESEELNRIKPYQARN